jgi:hypothetical protein
MLRILNIVFFVGLPLFAQHNALSVSAGQNAEIADWLSLEAARQFRGFPDTVSVQINVDPALQEAGRAGWLFFLGEQRMRLTLHYSASADSTAPPLQGSLSQDTSWLLGNCGMLECTTKPMPAQERLTVLKSLASESLAKLRKKLNEEFGLVQKADSVKADSAKTDTTSRDSAGS